MNYYQFHIADWALHTSHLTLVEEAVYRRLLDYYYDSESPIPEETDRVIRRLRLSEQKETVGFILAEFFVLQDGFWHNKRADAEILAYQKRANVARENGKGGGRPKKNNSLQNKNPEKTKSVNSGNPEKTISKANQEPLTKNQEPLTNKKTTSAKKFTDEDFAMACEFHESLSAQIPGFKKPNLESWANDIRLMRQIDKRSQEDIRAMWRFARVDQFWQTNVLCPATLREKFDKLTAKAIAKNQAPAQVYQHPSAAQQRIPSSHRSLKEIVAEQEARRD